MDACWRLQVEMQLDFLCSQYAYFFCPTYDHFIYMQWQRCIRKHRVSFTSLAAQRSTEFTTNNNERNNRPGPPSKSLKPE